MRTRCAEWARLEPWIERRTAAGADDDGSLLAAEVFAHLEECAACRAAAVAADPTLALRPLVFADGTLENEVEAMRQAVSTLRRSSPPVRRRGPVWWRAAAVIALAAGALYQLPVSRPEPPAGAGIDAALQALSTMPVDAGFVSAEFSRQPVVEDLDRPEARVYELGGRDLAVVMIVDAKLDV